MPKSIQTKLPSGSWFNLGLGLILTVQAARQVSLGRWNLWLGFTILIALYLLGSWFLDWRKSRRPALPQYHQDAEESDEGDEPLRSLVLLLDQPRTISGRSWIAHLGEALGVDLLSDDPKAENFVMPMPHPALQSESDACFMLKIPAGVFWIIHISRPYFENDESWASRIPDRRMREAMLGHHAWISVDLVSWLDGSPDQTRIYDILGKVIAVLAGPDVRVIFSPELNRANEFDPMLLPKLAGGDPLSLFDGPTFAPVLEARSDDEQMEAAIAEARSRWPEFVFHFNQRNPAADRPFIVKAPFCSGEETEHMWMIVNAIQDEIIHGTLANHPHRLPDHYEGQNVSVRASELTDWLCADTSDAPVGGWTQKVLNAQQARRN